MTCGTILVIAERLLCSVVVDDLLDVRSRFSMVSVNVTSGAGLSWSRLAVAERLISWRLDMKFTG